MKSLVRPSQGFWGTKDHAHFLSANIEKYFKGTREQNIFFGTGNMVILKITFREHVRLFLGNMAPPGRAYLVVSFCTHLGSAKFHI